MKRIVVFGDSLSWGYLPENELLPPGSKVTRLDDDQRWPGVLQSELGDGFTVIVEGLNGRTTVRDDPISPYRCGADQIIPVLDSQAPFDLVIIMLGTNDLKSEFSWGAQDIARGAGILVNRALQDCAADFAGEPRVLLVSPPHLGEDVDTLSPSDLAFVGALQKSKELAGHYKVIADQYGVGFFNAASVVTASAIDQVHLDLGQHAVLGRAIAPVVRQILQPDKD